MYLLAYVCIYSAIPGLLAVTFNPFIFKVIIHTHTHTHTHIWTSLVAQMVKYLPAMWETWVQSLCQEDPLEKEMATHSNTLAWKIPWTEEPCRLQSMGSQRVGHY